MSKEELHGYAESSTPGVVTIPPTWRGLIVWAVGKWGIGIVFLVLLVPVYQDLKESNRRLSEISGANVQVLTALAEKIEITNQRLARLESRTP